MCDSEKVLRDPGNCYFCKLLDMGQTRSCQHVCDNCLGYTVRPVRNFELDVPFCKYNIGNYITQCGIVYDGMSQCSCNMCTDVTVDDYSEYGISQGEDPT